MFKTFLNLARCACSLICFVCGGPQCFGGISLQDLAVEVVMILTCCCSLLYCEGSIMFVQKS